MEIPESALEGHLGHGDYIGECEENESEDAEETQDESNETTENTSNESLNEITGNVINDIQDSTDSDNGHGNDEDRCDEDNPNSDKCNPILKAEAGPDQVVNEKTIVKFYGDSGFQGNADVIFKWDFGDGNIVEGANLKSPEHVYDKEGVYFVNLIVEKGIFSSEDSTAVDVNDVNN